MTLSNQNLRDRSTVCNNRKIIFLLLLMLACTAVVCAEDLIPSELTEAAQSAQEAAQGTLVRTIISICAIGVGIGMAVNKDSQRMKTAGFAVIIGAVLIMSGPSIVSKLMSTN